ncbi:hypothetical protein CCHR01_16157 [Colletotrichum chrysophilum]|uniref:Uncharacterized protein n=1 Tax=Colletotrichum chrysophilum TaxID=1836956 RepID=A0AAD9A6B9_9PEZI|nr:hypothetical protein CCHR01_16157 [Colletotrichum chrysophilum]
MEGAPRPAMDCSFLPKQVPACLPACPSSIFPSPARLPCASSVPRKASRRPLVLPN